MVASFFTAFDPELKITVREGKVFDAQDERMRLQSNIIMFR